MTGCIMRAEMKLKYKLPNQALSNRTAENRMRPLRIHWSHSIELLRGSLTSAQLSSPIPIREKPNLTQKRARTRVSLPRNLPPRDRGVETYGSNVSLPN